MITSLTCKNQEEKKENKTEEEKKCKRGRASTGNREGIKIMPKVISQYSSGKETDTGLFKLYGSFTSLINHWHSRTMLVIRTIEIQERFIGSLSNFYPPSFPSKSLIVNESISGERNLCPFSPMFSKNYHTFTQKPQHTVTHRSKIQLYKKTEKYQ